MTISNRLPSLSIVIPALNEEEIIGKTIQRTLEAREHIMEQGRVSEVNIIVVNDGSTDSTESIAKMYKNVTVLTFDQNRGYGAALKTGFQHTKSDLVAFMDADGTCDPFSFADLCRALDDHGADIAVGSRMGPGSQMPWIRTLGNHLFATILGLLSKLAVTDCASGMRVLRRSCLKNLYPLPNGLDFTPAISAQALLESKMALIEVPIQYSERVGRSKLSVLKDGIQFLSVIIKTAVMYTPSRILLPLGGFSAICSLMVGLLPTVYYVQYGRLEEWMIYRVLLSFLLLTISLMLVFAGLISEAVAALGHGRPWVCTGITLAFYRLFTPPWPWILFIGLISPAIIVVWPGIIQYLEHGTVDMHWSRAVVAMLLTIGSVLTLLSSFILNLIELINRRYLTKEDIALPDRVHP